MDKTEEPGGQRPDHQTKTRRGPQFLNTRQPLLDAAHIHFRALTDLPVLQPGTPSPSISTPAVQVEPEYAIVNLNLLCDPFSSSVSTKSQSIPSKVYNKNLKTIDRIK